MTDMYEIFCGSIEAIKMLKEKGVRALNPKTHKSQIIDRNARYEIKKEGDLYYLISNKNLRQIAEEKGLIL